MCMALPLLPPEKIVSGLQAVTEISDHLNFAPRKRISLNSVFQFIQRQWIDNYNGPALENYRLNKTALLQLHSLTNCPPQEFVQKQLMELQEDLLERKATTEAQDPRQNVCNHFLTNVATLLSVPCGHWAGCVTFCVLQYTLTSSGMKVTECRLPMRCHMCSCLMACGLWSTRRYQLLLLFNGASKGWWAHRSWYLLGEFLMAASHHLDNTHNDAYNVLDDIEEPGEELLQVYLDTRIHCQEHRKEIRVVTYMKITLRQEATLRR